MPKLAQPKTDADYRTAKPKDREYLISDGKGLNLRVRPATEGAPEGSKVWIFRYRFGGKEKNLAIKGGYPSVSLKLAREEAKRMRDMIARGEDPGSVRKAGEKEDARRLADVRDAEAIAANTFEKIAREWWDRKAVPKLTPGNARDTLRRLENNIFPFVGARAVVDLRPSDILAPLRLVEQRGARESAHRILGVCSQVFRYAVASGILESDPTRDLRGALESPDERHFAALTDPTDVAALLRSIASYHGSTPTQIALRLGVLTFVRPGNLREAEWSEFVNLEDPARAEWRIPGAKMKVKTSRPFVVPLAPQSVALLDAVRPLAGRSRYVFPSVLSADRPMSNNTVNTALRRMGYTRDEMTGHGVRAMARTLCHEVLGFAPEVIEEQLAHGKSGPLGDAYDRTTHMQERRRLMREWAGYLDRLERGEG